MRAYTAPLCVCVCVRARVCVCDHGHPPGTVRSLSVGVDCRAVLLAGVPLGGGVQREHRRVEHRVCVDHAVGTRRFRPAARQRRRPGRARRGFDAVRPVVRGGPTDAPLMCT
jgi:hypothetical protein